MIYGTCVFLYALHHHTKPPKTRSKSYILALIICSIAVTIVYLSWKNPIFHQVCYGGLVLLLLYEAVIALRNYPAIKNTVLASLCFYLLGFFLWNIDNGFCSSLRTIRAKHSGNAVVKMGTQLHAWWHIFTGYATYLHIVFSSYARSLHLKRSCSVQLLDELPMIYGSCVQLYTLRCVGGPYDTVNRKAFLAGVIYSALATFVYLFTNVPTLFQLFYGVLVILSIRESIATYHKHPELKLLLFKSYAYYVIGFLLWNIDVYFCSTLRHVRGGKTGLDLVYCFTQFHALWHLLAGFGTYLQLQLVIYARQLHFQCPCYLKSYGGFPYLEWKALRAR